MFASIVLGAIWIVSLFVYLITGALIIREMDDREKSDMACKFSFWSVLLTIFWFIYSGATIVT